MKSTRLTTAVCCHQALAHPVRLRFLAAMRGGQMCVGELQALSGLAFSTVSRHLSELERVGLVEQRKEGRWVWYRLASGPDATRLLECVWQQVSADRTVDRDQKRAQHMRDGRRGSSCRAPNGVRHDDPMCVAGNATQTPEELG